MGAIVRHTEKLVSAFLLSGRASCRTNRGVVNRTTLDKPQRGATPLMVAGCAICAPARSTWASY